eukprot:1858840-Rhodomonas_salina.2
MEHDGTITTHFQLPAPLPHETTSLAGFCGVANGHLLGRDDGKVVNNDDVVHAVIKLLVERNVILVIVAVRALPLRICRHPVKASLCCVTHLVR